IDRLVAPIVVTSPRAGVYWTPNGNHRRSVLDKLKAGSVPAIAIPEHEVAFQILALNTEKAHNVKVKSLEVIRMYRGLVAEEPSRGEEDYAFQFEAPHFISLGLLYETNKDRKSTRLNSSHLVISYAVFCLKKKKTPYKSVHSQHYINR